MNYVTVIYLLNLLVYGVYFFGKSGSEVDISPVNYIISMIMSLLLILGGYFNAKKNKTYRSVLWMFFVNILFFTMSGLFDQFGNNFNLFSTVGNDSFIFTLALIVYNGYLFPLIVMLDKSGFALVLPVLLSFILPSLGYWIGKIIVSKNSDSPEEN
ncbi:hypothetical protein [Chryseobacterium jejuense]|uniref:Uncharacterized protein n=1 Tax=Chryseobacterium jejuense TaxID=445960 RepID=A0A2X2VF07_CHRJE|nr:hypothetical protein [Chryseobacterium jejuense]SDI83679.1 hypothetical protein SAMN05421542_1969 [Chryseobacterium jejuense]SQB27666.1 Uncharacterised protein [Chryseobacterium jejuense]